MEGENNILSSLTSSLGSETDSSSSPRKSHNFFYSIYQQHGRSVTNKLKTWTRLNRQLAEVTSQRRFLLRCRSNDLLPRHFTRSKHSNSFHFHSNYIKKRFLNLNLTMSNRQFKLIIKDTHFHISYLQKSLNKYKTLLLDSSIDKDILTNFFNFENMKFKRLLCKHNLKYKKKFDLLVNKNFVKHNVGNSDWVKNLTDVSIPKDVIDIVSLGQNFNFHSTINKPIIVDIIKNVEVSLRNLEIEENVKNVIREKITCNLNVTKSKNSHIKIQDRILAKKCRITHNFLKQNNDIIFTKADKGNVTVCLNKSDYNSKMLNLLSDTSTYINIKRNPLQNLKRNTCKILNNLNENNLLKYKYHKNQLTLTETALAKCYGLPKIHKPNLSFRPIISLINSPTYSLAKHIYEDLKQGITLPKSHINNSFELITKLNNIKIPENYVFLSLDVSSLFTNITCDLVKRSLDRRLHEIRSRCKIPFDEIIECTKFLFDNTYFSFNGKFFKQIKGTPMGSPISPLFADIVMDDLEKECLNKLKELNCEPLFYYRYVDDTFLCVKKDFVNLVVDTFNSYNEHLKFTFELEQDNKINFLDVTLIKNKNNIITDWYQKPTSSDRLLNYFSNHPLQQKKNIVYNLIDRAILLSNKRFHTKNLKLVTELLLKNSYPAEFIHKNIKIRLNKIKHSNNSNNNNSELYRKKIKIALPFTENFDQLTQILKMYNISTIPIVKTNLNSVIKLGKDKTETLDKDHVVYQFSCKNCPASYIGETKRALRTRINEHKNNKKVDAVVTAHQLKYNHQFDWENVKILDTEFNYNKRTISEMIHIKSNVNSINKKEDIHFLNKAYFPILRN